MFASQPLHRVQCKQTLPGSDRSDMEVSSPTTRRSALLVPTRTDIAAWRIASRCLIATFLRQLAPSGETLRVQHTCGDGFLNGAARFMGVHTVAETAVRGELGDFSEQGLDAKGRIADAERAHSRRVYDPSTAFNSMKRARGRGVTSFGIVFANAPGFLGPFRRQARQSVHQRRLADTRGSDQRHCLPVMAPWGDSSCGISRSGV